MQRIREMTSRVTLKRGRAILVAVRVLDSVGWPSKLEIDEDPGGRDGLTSPQAHKRAANW